MQSKLLTSPARQAAISVLAILTALLAIAVLAGWMLEIPFLKRLLPDTVDVITSYSIHYTKLYECYF